MSNKQHFCATYLKNIQKVVDIAKVKISQKIKNTITVLGFGEKGSLDHSLPTYDQLILQFKEGKIIVPGCSYTCLIRPEQVYTDLSYNRGEELSVNKIKDNVVKYKGFEHKLAGAIQISVRPDGDGSYLFSHPITTKGNHRTSSAWLVDVPLIKADVFFHPLNFTCEECVIEEASIHHGDCTDRSNQVPEQKFVSAVFAGQSNLFESNSPEKQAVDLNNFLNKHGYYVSTKIYGKNVKVPYNYDPITSEKSAKKITSHDSIATARAMYGDKIVGEILKSIHEVSKSNIIPSNFVRASSLFFFAIEEPLKEEDGTMMQFLGSDKQTPMSFLVKKTKKSPLDIKIDFFNFIFNECKPKYTFDKITADSGKYKGPELYAARLVFLFNQYVQDRLIEYCFPKSILPNRRVRFLCSNDSQWNYIRNLSKSSILGSFLDNVMTTGGSI